ncbi:MAG: cysteine peptidase family C39 domain-containing protein [Dehalococcoidales bacterium]|jgi:ABC-type bacteriocin/lantibiotic exporter with double-glycine peptidase domain|nr:cysteine peptidase family C39 domain-containing protein [Dehalococcoidales bacterium]MDD3994195.1 cysteine peptidase family C39 domain-containing protein [Dehalococcoidales bacterium]
MIIDLPGGRQTFDFDCGATALQLVMAYFGVEVRMDELYSRLLINSNGTLIKNIIFVAEEYGFDVIEKYDTGIDEIKRFIDTSHPVIVLVQAWAEKYMTLEEWHEDYDDGHYVIVVGYYENKIVFEDPSSFRKTWLTEEEFLIRWHDKDPETDNIINQFALILTGRKPEPAHKLMEHME